MNTDGDWPFRGTLTLHLDEIELLHGTQHRLVVQGQVKLGRDPGRAADILVPRQIGVCRPCNQHGANLQQKEKV